MGSRFMGMGPLHRQASGIVLHFISVASGLYQCLKCRGTIMLLIPMHEMVRKIRRL